MLNWIVGNKTLFKKWIWHQITDKGWYAIKPKQTNLLQLIYFSNNHDINLIIFLYNTWRQEGKKAWKWRDVKKTIKVFLYNALIDLIAVYAGETTS